MMIQYPSVTAVHILLAHKKFSFASGNKFIDDIHQVTNPIPINKYIINDTKYVMFKARDVNGFECYYRKYEI